MMDRYMRIALTLMVITLLVLTTRLMIEPRLASADLDVTPFKAGQKPAPVEVPKTWGRFVGMAVVRDGGLTLKFLAFEAPDGTIRTRVAAPGSDVIRK